MIVSLKDFTPYWIVKIISHDEWSGPEVQDIVAFSDEDHALAVDYVRLLRYYSRDMSSDFYWTVDEPTIHTAHGLYVEDGTEVVYNGPDYYKHLLKFADDKVDFRLPSNEL
jgi:hypothetical protein